MSVPELVAGQIVGGRFTVRRERARTALMATYEAITAPSRGVELKILDPSLRQSSTLDERMKKTMSATNELPSSFALRVLDVGIDEHTGAPFVATELSTTPSLAELVTLCPLAPEEVVYFLRNLAAALDAGHARGLSHLTLTPENVFVGPGPRFDVRLVDFGASLILGAQGIDARWAAPELAEQPRAACDVFSAGLVTLFAASGAVLRDRRETSLRAPATSLAREVGSPVDPRFDAPLARALAKSPGERYSSVPELAEAVAAAFSIAPRAPSAPSVSRLAVPVPVPTSPISPAAPPPVAPLPAAPMPASPPPVAPPVVAMPLEPALAVPVTRGTESRRRPLMFVGIGLGVMLSLFALAGVGWTMSKRAQHSAGPEPSASSRPIVMPPSVATAPPAATPVATPPVAPVAAPEPAAAGSVDGVALTVTCTPECDTITIDGSAVASFPTSLSPGAHTVIGRRGMHPPQTKGVTLEPGKPQTVSFVFMAARPPPKKPCGKFLQRCD